MIRIGNNSGRRNLLALVMLLCVLPGCDSLFPGSEASNDKDNDERTIFALGRLEPSKGIISITGIPGAQLKELDPDVKENQLVPANGVLGLLSGYKVGKEQLEALQAKRRLAILKHEQDLQMVVAQEIQAEASLAEAKSKKNAWDLQEEKLAFLKEASNLAITEHQRLSDLSQADPELVNPLELAKKGNEMDLAIQDHAIAEFNLKSAKEATENAIRVATENLELAKLSKRHLQGGANLEALDEEIDVAKETLKRSILVWPGVDPNKLPDVREVKCEEEHKGEPVDLRASEERPYTVLKKFLRPGESITQTPVLQLGDLREMVCVAEVYEADVKKLKVGQEATIHSPAFSDGYKDERDESDPNKKSGGMQGIVESISQIVAPPGVKNRNPLAPADRSVVEVRVKIEDQKAAEHARSFVGMKVMVKFVKQDSAGSMASDKDAKQDSPQE